MAAEKNYKEFYLIRFSCSIKVSLKVEKRFAFCKRRKMTWQKAIVKNEKKRRKNWVGQKPVS